jgi:ABC-type cobalt transport system substrate-binding protein
MAVGKRLFATTPEGIVSGLSKIAPHVAIDVSWEEDLHYVWDGDGPDPGLEGYVAHDVTVSAETIIDGRKIDGKAYLGGVYEKQGERDQNIHGYFPQMVDEALSELYKEISGKEPVTSRKRWEVEPPSGESESILAELRNAIKFTNVSMKEIYERERREHERRERRRRR